MKDLFWLTEEQMERLRPVFSKSHGVPRVDDRRVLPDRSQMVGAAGAFRGGSVSGNGGLERLAAATGVWLVDDDECLCEQLLPGGRHHVASRGTSSQEYSARAFAVCRRTSSGMQSSAAKIFCASTSISV